MLPISPRPLPFTPGLVKKGDFVFLESQRNYTPDASFPPGCRLSSVCLLFSPLIRRCPMHNHSVGDCFLPTEVPTEPQKGAKQGTERRAESLRPRGYLYLPSQ